MMSLNKMSLGVIVKKQFQYKLKAYASVFSSLVVLQIIAILFHLEAMDQVVRIIITYLLIRHSIPIQAYLY